MGKIYRWIAVIVFFPITVVFYLLKFLCRLIDKQMTNKYFSRMDIRDIDGLDGYEFEEFLYNLFRSLNISVVKTQKSRDYGADLILKFKNHTVVIQSKLYFNRTVGNSAVQEINTAKSYYNADIAVVITNSYFSKPAQNLAGSTNIKLIDRNKLQEFISSTKSHKRDIINDWQTNC